MMSNDEKMYMRFAFTAFFVAGFCILCGFEPSEQLIGFGAGLLLYIPASRFIDWVTYKIAEWYVNR